MLIDASEVKVISPHVTRQGRAKVDGLAASGICGDKIFQDHPFSSRHSSHTTADMPSTHNVDKPWDTDDVDKWKVCYAPFSIDCLVKKNIKADFLLLRADRRVQARRQLGRHLQRGILLLRPLPQIPRNIPQGIMAADHPLAGKDGCCLYSGFGRG